MGQDLTAYRSGVLVVGEYRARVFGGDGHVAVVSVSDGKILRERRGICRNSVFSVEPITRSFVALNEGRSGRIHLYDFVNDSILHTLERGARYTDACGMTYLKKKSILAAKRNLQMWKLDESEWSNSEFVGFLPNEKRRDVQSISSNEEEESNWVLVGFDGNSKGQIGAIYDISRREAIGLLKKATGGDDGNATTWAIEMSSVGIVTGSKDKMVRIWDKRTFQETSSALCSSHVHSILCPKDREHGIIAGCSGGGITSFDARRMDQILRKWSVGGHVQSLAAVEQDQVAFCGDQYSHSDGFCGLLNYDNEEKFFTSPLYGYGWSVCYFPPFEEDLRSVSERTADFFVAPEAVTRGQCIGGGKEGKVYEGKYQTSPAHSIVVAIKRFVIAKNEEVSQRLGGSFASAEKLEHEVRLMTEMSHENVMRCYGCFLEEDEYSPETPIVNILLEFCAGGHLGTWLPQHKGRLTVLRKVTILLQIARGLAHLHEREILHSDVSLDNVLVTSAEVDAAVMKVSDFGLSNHFGTVLSDELKGKPRYMPPSRSGDKRKVDVYSFGILTWEIWNDGVHAYSGEGLRVAEPGFGMGPVEFLQSVSVRKLRPRIDECAGMPQELADLVQACWDESAEDRPTFAEVVRDLDGLICHIEGDDHSSPIRQRMGSPATEVQADEEEEEEGESVEQQPSLSIAVPSGFPVDEIPLGDDQQKWLSDILSIPSLEIPRDEPELIRRIRSIVAGSSSFCEAMGRVVDLVREREIGGE